MNNDYYEKVYSGLYGKMMGIILGSPVEPPIWTHDHILNTYGELTGYVKHYKNYAADDDMNGPLFFIKALDKQFKEGQLKAQDIGDVWLNYSREGLGMFWWGGYGTSTEHTAFLNLKKGIKAPDSGSIACNGKVNAEQIGGQIFIDTWGLIFPNNPGKAADYSEIAASVSHDGEGLYGARYVAACIAKAFGCNDVNEIVQDCLQYIPQESNYAKVTKAVIDFHKNNPDDFRACFKMLDNEWGYDKYPGICHIIPNAGVVILALLYGNGKLARTIEVATMCGWDTDCNAGNVGTILGVMGGYNSLDKAYKKQINDVIVTSSISGYLNINDLPTVAKEIAYYGYVENEKIVPSEIENIVNNRHDILFDFDTPGTVHGFRIDNEIKYSILPSLEYNGSMNILLDRCYRGVKGYVYYKPYYQREDFDDERYSPVFSPKVISGQKISSKVHLKRLAGDNIGVLLFVKTVDGKYFEGKNTDMQEDGTYDLEFIIPDTKGYAITEVGFVLESYTRMKNKHLGNLFVENFHITGKGYNTIDFANETIEFQSITQFSHNHGSWKIEEDKMVGLSGDMATSFTGNFYTKDIEVETKITPHYGTNHMIVLRSIGELFGYYVGFDDNSKIALYKNEKNLLKLKADDFDWSLNVEYNVKATIVGNIIKFYINEELILEHNDDNNPLEYGMYGFAMLNGGRIEIDKIKMTEL